MTTMSSWRIAPHLPLPYVLLGAVIFSFWLSVNALIPAAHAIGPTLPLGFDEGIDRTEPWVLRLRVDPEQMKDIRIERQIFRRGELLRSERIEPAYERKGESAVAPQVTLSLRFKGIEDLPPGAYAQKIIAEGHWSVPGNNKPLHIERWFYFMVGKGEAARIELEEYDKIADPSEYGVGPDGERISHTGGGGVKAKVPLQRTKSTPAVPLGRFGEIAEEQPPGKTKETSTAERDKSEIQEK